jgi:hypothetical protein
VVTKAGLTVTTFVGKKIVNIEQECIYITLADFDCPGLGPFV